MIFWVGANVLPQILLDLFGVDDIVALDPSNMVSFVVTRWTITLNGIYADGTPYSGHPAVTTSSIYPWPPLRSPWTRSKDAHSPSKFGRDGD